MVCDCTSCADCEQDVDWMSPSYLEFLSIHCLHCNICIAPSAASFFGYKMRQQTHIGCYSTIVSMMINICCWSWTSRKDHLYIYKAYCLLIHYMTFILYVNQVTINAFDCMSTTLSASLFLQAFDLCVSWLVEIKTNVPPLQLYCTVLYQHYFNSITRIRKWL